MLVFLIFKLSNSKERDVTFHCQEEVIAVSDEPLRLKLSSQTEISCDFAVWATGVTPSTVLWKDNCVAVIFSRSSNNNVLLS